jgi:anti-sigma regulatory factor (Ser/Thr protein kinase)
MFTVVLPVTEPSHVAVARRAAVACALRLGFDISDAGRVAIVATELSLNLVRHAREGQIIVARFEDEAGMGVEVLALDRGPGMADIAACVQDGYSTAGSAGQGLGAVKRQSQTFDVVSSTRSGSGVLARVRPRSIANPSIDAGFGAVSLPKPGEEVCGDAWCAVPGAGGCQVLIIDGLGHGAEAARAAGEGVRLFREHVGEAPETIVQQLHAGLRHTRGAAVAVASIQPREGRIRFCGLGNIAGCIIDSSGVHRTVSLSGTAGLSASRIHAFEYPLEAPFIVVLHTDGLVTNWSSDRYPELLNHHPTLIAGVLYRDFSRGRDDATVFVAKEGGYGPDDHDHPDQAGK